MALTALDMMKGWVEDLSAKNRALVEENKTLKCTIVTLTQELETERMSNRKTSVNTETQVDEVSLGRRKKVHSQSDVNIISDQQIPRGTTGTGGASQIDDTPENGKMRSSVFSMSSVGANSALEENHVKEELDEITDNLQTETPSAEEDSEIDIKEEDVGYGQSKSNQDCDNSTHNPILADRRNVDQSSESASGDFGAEVGTGTDSEVNHSSSSHLTQNVLCQEIVQPQVSSQPLSGRRGPYLTTRTAHKIHKCENCSTAFDTQFKLREHKKSHTGKKQCRPRVHYKSPLKCSICEKSFTTKRVLANHMKTHNAEKPSMALEVEDKGFSAKRSCTGEKANPSIRPKKQRKVETQVCNEEEMPGAVVRIDPPCVDEVENDPLKIKKVLERILSNLGKNDLLNARLVSRAWNDESLEVLRNSKFTQMLREFNIEQFIIFVTSNVRRPLMIPFHLNFSVSSSSLYLAWYNRILTSHVDSLCQIFGQQCVSTLTLTASDTDWTEENIKEIGLIECLALVAPGLETLDLTRFNARVDFLKNQMITFPKLKKLICNTSACRFGKRGPGLTYISMIENSPNLEDLTLTDPCDLDTWPLNFNQLKSLSLDSFFKPQNILDKILSSPGPPVLQKLSAEILRANDNIVVYNILKSVSTTLKSLIFHGYSVGRNTLNLRFPKLPHLEHFGLEYRVGDTSRLDAGNIDFSRENFPSLKSVELPIGFIFTPSPERSEEKDGASIEFPNFKKLTLRVNSIDGPEDVNGPLEKLQKIFPTPSRLCLINNVGLGNDSVKYVLYRLMKSDWSKSIQQIEMIGFSPSYLGHMLDRVGPRVSLGNWYGMLKESLKIEYQNTMKRMGVEFEETENVNAPWSFTLRRVK